MTAEYDPLDILAATMNILEEVRRLKLELKAHCRKISKFDLANKGLIKQLDEMEARRAKAQRFADMVKIERDAFKKAIEAEGYAVVYYGDTDSPFNMELKKRVVSENAVIQAQNCDPNLLPWGPEEPPEEEEESYADRVRKPLKKKTRLVRGFEVATSHTPGDASE